MSSFRRVALASTVLGSVGLSAAACSDDSRTTFEPIADSGVDGRADLPPPTLSDAGSDDSAVDAGSVDFPDEAVVCAVEPCAVDIVAGQNHFCVLMSDKTLRCWGDDSRGQLGAGVPAPDGDGGSSPISVVSGLANVTQISAGGATTCARLADGTLKCWGGNDLGQLGLTTDPPTNDWDPHPTPSTVAVVAASRVDVGVHSACAIVAAGEVFCWGADDQSQLGRGPASWFGGPAKTEALTGKAASTAAGTNTSFAVDGAGNVSSWGATTGAVGVSAGRVASVSPDPRPGELSLGGVTSFAVSSWNVDYPIGGAERGLAHACAVARGSLYCWGDSLYGAMGFGAPFAFLTPTAVPLPGTAHPQRVAVSIENTCVRMTDGSIRCAGDDSHGQLGRGAGDAGLFSDFFTSATAFSGDAVRLALTDAAVCVIVQGGKVMCWGGNAYGELGRGSTDGEPHPTPTPIRL